jgi:hypothetical protein
VLAGDDTSVRIVAGSENESGSDKPICARVTNYYARRLRRGCKGGKTKHVAIKVELVSADKAGEILERALKIRNPELWQTRRKNAAKQKAKARRQGKPLPPISRWAPSKATIGNGRWVEHKPMEMLGLSNLNRPISFARTELYAQEMEAGRWYFTPDPIVITDEGYVVNGQHRLGAADAVDWSQAGEVPQFLVVWGVDKKTALLMDEAKRSADDRRHIALSYATADDRNGRNAIAA